MSFSEDGQQGYIQRPLFENPKFPRTRFQGSKYKLLPWLREIFESLDFDTALDAFGGTASVSYLLKELRKEVTYNDNMRFNYFVGKAIIENSAERLSDTDLDFLLTPDSSYPYKSIIYESFPDIYYLDEENRWLDIVIQNIQQLEGQYKPYLGYWALFQSALVKRPYNLFHRKNLYVRTADVSRSFGNKATWDTPFETHFRKFVRQINQAVFDNGRRNKALNQDALELAHTPDLVYIDTPYIPAKGSLTNYFEFYHFLEGITVYDFWPEMIDYNSKHRRLKPRHNPWMNKNKILSLFKNLFHVFSGSQLVISYRSDGIPSVEDLLETLHKLGRKTHLEHMPYQYALSKNRASEIVIIAR